MNRGSRILRRFWRFCMIVCCVCAIVYVFRGDPTAVLLFALSGIAFFALAEWRLDRQ